MEKYIEALLAETKIAEIEKEVPIGAIIVKDGEIVAKSHNSRIKEGSVINHAEINAILLAEKVLGDWRLTGCDMYVTVEPCNMCMSIIREARIDNVFYLIKRQSYKHQYSKTNVCSIEGAADKKRVEEYRSILSNFFKLNCKR